MFKRKYGITFILMMCCIFIFTFGQFIPIYFIDIHVKHKFYKGLLSILLIATTLATFIFVYKSNRNKYLVRLVSFFIGVVTAALFGFWYFFLSLTIWTEASTLYVKKDNSNIKIISRYVDEGAFGGGTEPNDYQVVLRRPVLFLFKMETSIDTTKINKRDWIKSQTEATIQKYYACNLIY